MTSAERGGALWAAVAVGVVLAGAVMWPRAVPGRPAVAVLPERRDSVAADSAGGVDMAADGVREPAVIRRRIDPNHEF